MNEALTPAPTLALDNPAEAIAEVAADAVGEAEAAVDLVAAATAEAPAASTATPAAAPSAQEMSPAACAAKLKELFPALFVGGGVKPLKLRVQADIQERAPGVFTKAALSAFLRRHTGSTSYLMAISKARTRFDLDGQPAGDLIDEHRAAAVEELARRRGLQQERLDLEQAQARNRAGLLHDFERTTLTLPNFCALKGVTPEELPGLLEIARQEAAARPAEREVRDNRPQHAPRSRERTQERDAGRGGRRGGAQGRPRT
ncbi:ProQ/FinO family protein [Paucibacter sp. B2R-40]|uniref:ProQ/FinO family protein n=1 Tax=Paucibacter sp. B2R-40 TaxID=2893554 RepID=UPI0021E443F1|nr:ProQ/FinO family protein [Paucibacter sp. B2R-40]MCV2353154.1 ProQ/FinO family protein [Paucibacter sp. B2R-40]